MKYKIIAAGTAAELESKVNRDLRWGKWTPQGGIVTVEYPNAKDPDLIQTLWAQALVSTGEQSITTSRGSLALATMDSGVIRPEAAAGGSGVTQPEDGL